jgi:hypothetical protein
MVYDVISAIRQQPVLKNLERVTNSVCSFDYDLFHLTQRLQLGSWQIWFKMGLVIYRSLVIHLFVHSMEDIL